MSVWCVLVGFLAGLLSLIPVLAIRRGHPWGRRRGDGPTPPQKPE
jgi:hypothetical protein